MKHKSHGAFWDKLRREVNQKPLTAHPIFTDLTKGKLKRETIAELCAQLKYTVLDGIGSLALIVPQAPRPIKKEPKPEPKLSTDDELLAPKRHK